MRVVETFAPLFGHWQGSEEQYASPWGPATTARAIISFRAELGGAAMVSDYRQVSADGAERYGHGVFLVDDQRQVSAWLFDSSGHPPIPATGGWRGGDLVLTEITELGISIHRFAIDGDDLTYAIDLISGDGPDDQQPFLRGRYQALSTH